jgi:uncharacterized protein YjbJ (UPF0337 family)
MSGKMDEVKGKAKQAAGDLSDDKDLHDEGKADEAGGKVKQAAQKVKDGFDDAVDKVKGDK